MELRHHPLMSYCGLSNWPPVWKPANPRGDKPTLTGEIGMLKYVLCQESSKECFLIIVHEGVGYIGCLLFDDAAFCQQLGKLLENHAGRSIKEIGDLDLSATL